MKILITFLNYLFRTGYILYRKDKSLKSLDVICTPNENSKYEWRGTDGSTVECVKGEVVVSVSIGHILLIF
jgi:hypothetical protein